MKRNGMYNLGNDAPTDMDSLHYCYKAGTNQLDYVYDAVNTGGWPYDLKEQSTGNYQYDKIGNLTYDRFDGIDNIRWTVYGKIDSITKSNGTTIKYTYDASGNRIGKTVYTGGTQKHTWYTRDGQGNTLLTYTAGDAAINSGDLTAAETYLYGSSRVGLSEEKINVQHLPTVPATSLPFLGTGYTYGFTRGLKGYELTNHLGNVMVVVSDAKKVGNANTGINVINSYDYQAKLAQDFYAFGMAKYGRRNYDNQNYRYGFNGKENDNDVQGEYDLQDYGMRIYDPRLGRFLSVDPIAKKYPELTPYQFASNRPIDGIDLDGMEYMPVIPKFSNSGKRTWQDYVGAFDNGVIDLLNLVPTTWNASVNAYKSWNGGTGLSDLKRDANQVLGSIKLTASKIKEDPLKTLSSPDALEFAVNLYVGFKVLPGGGNKGNLLKPTVNISSLASLVKTNAGEAFFWSGRTEGFGGAELALKIAKNKGGTTLEGLIESKGIDMPKWDINNPASIKAWEDISAQYASQVSGKVRAVVGNELRQGNIWENVELPRLKANKNVTEIITIDPKTLKETTIFKR